MRLLFRQRMFSWFDSYDIYDEYGEVMYQVKGVLSWGHCLKIYDGWDHHVGTVKEEVLALLPRFALYVNGEQVGEIRKKLTFFRPSFTLSCGDWQIDGDLWEWNYRVTDSRGDLVMDAHKELLHLTDTYVLDIQHEEDALYCLMVVLAIDAAKCSEGNN